MRLHSSDSATVSLRPAGYQLDRSGGTAGPGTDWDDDDWLMIHGEVRTADGRAWEFTDPCLTALEAAALASWLRAAAGQAAGPATEPILFTEPNLAFLPGTGDGGHTRIQVRFSYESLPGVAEARFPRLAGRRVSPATARQPQRPRRGGTGLGS